MRYIANAVGWVLFCITFPLLVVAVLVNGAAVSLIEYDRSVLSETKALLK